MSHTSVIVWTKQFVQWWLVRRWLVRGEQIASFKLTFGELPLRSLRNRREGTRWASGAGRESLTEKDKQTNIFFTYFYLYLDLRYCHGANYCNQFKSVHTIFGTYCFNLVLKKQVSGKGPHVQRMKSTKQQKEWTIKWFCGRGPAYVGSTHILFLFISFLCFP